MASFPTEWSIYDHTLFASYEVNDLHDAPLGMNMLMKLGADGRSLGDYKILLFGGGTMTARYTVENILYNCPTEFAGKLIIISVTSDQVTPLSPTPPQYHGVTWTFFSVRGWCFSPAATAPLWTRSL